MRINLKQALIQSVKGLLALGLIVWLIRQGAIDFSALKRLATPAPLAAGGVLMFGMIFANNFRWLLLLRAQGIQTTVGKTLPLTLIGMFFNFAMPGGVGGDVVKGYYLIQDHKEHRMAGVVSILMDRIVGFFMMIAMAALALVLSWELVTHNARMSALAAGVFAMFSVFTVFFAFALSRRVGTSRLVRLIFDRAPGGGLLRKAYDVLHAYRRSPRSLAGAFGLSLISQFSQILLIYMVARVMGLVEIPFLAYCFLVPVGIVATALPVAPAGIGIGQAAFFFLFNLYLGRESQVGPTAITLTQILSFLWGLSGAYFYLARGRPKLEPEGRAVRAG